MCGKFGHTALKCYHRFDPSLFVSTSSSPSGSTQPAMKAHMTAMVTTPEVVVDSNWYPDSRAANHCTPALGNLMCHEHYRGLEQIHMGDGNGLPIHNIG